MSERTFALIKPDAVKARTSGRILARIEEAGFTIRGLRFTHLSKKDAEGFYAVHRERAFFGSLTEFMSSGPCIVMALEAPDAIKKWRTLMGAGDPAKADAGTLRKEFGASYLNNATHGSHAPETAAFELGYFFRGMELPVTMPFTLNHVVPWGRSFDEYRRMFALTDGDLAGRILGCGDGPASFNAEATRIGARVTSCDPIYRWDTPQIQSRIAATYDQILAQTRLNADEFVWDHFPTPEAMGAARMAAMTTFLADYETGRRDGRYVDAELPSLPFDDGAFDLAVSSHFLFLYSAQLGDGLHQLAIREMCRVAREVRIFPLLTLGGQPSSFVAGAIADLAAAGLDATIETVPYEFQRGGNQMLRVRR